MMRKRRLGEIVWPVARHVLLIAGAVVMVTPFVWMVSVSLKPAQEVYQPKFTILPGVSPAGEVDIVLESTGRGSEKLKVVNAILVNLGLTSEIDFVDGMSLQKGVTKAEGEEFKRIVEEAGGKVRIEPNCHATTGDFLRPILCRNWSLIDNYKVALNPRRGNLMRYMFNGVIVTTIIFLAQVLIAIPCAYSLAKLRFRGRQFIFFMVIFCLLIPPQVPAIPLYCSGRLESSTLTRVCACPSSSRCSASSCFANSSCRCPMTSSMRRDWTDLANIRSFGA